jgi:alkylated DNA nucleotide flippase Atl1
MSRGLGGVERAGHRLHKAFTLPWHRAAHQKRIPKQQAVMAEQRRDLQAALVRKRKRPPVAALRCAG